MHFWTYQRGRATLVRPEDRYSVNKKGRVTRMASKKITFEYDPSHDTALGIMLTKLFLLLEEGSIERISVSDFGKLPLQLSLLVEGSWTNINFGSAFTLISDLHSLLQQWGIEGDDKSSF